LREVPAVLVGSADVTAKLQEIEWSWDLVARPVYEHIRAAPVLYLVKAGHVSGEILHVGRRSGSSLVAEDNAFIFLSNLKAQDTDERSAKE
jgi:hypothetical protein